MAHGLSLKLREIQPGPGGFRGPDTRPVGRAIYVHGTGPFYSNRSDRRRLLFTREGREQTRFAEMVAEKGRS